MSRSYESASRHCKLGRDCGVCHPGKPEPPARDRRRLQALREMEREYLRDRVRRSGPPGPAESGAGSARDPDPEPARVGPGD